jgi:hypothetical protein
MNLSVNVMNIYVFGIHAVDENWTQFVLSKFKVNQLIENHSFINPEIPFIAVSSSLGLELTHNILVSSAYNAMLKLF